MIAEYPLAFFLQPVLADVGLLLLQLLLFFTSFWLIFLILIQRGKGGGLTAAFGGGGGDSAFGAKAGDAFTKITIVSALVWITLCMVTIARYNPPEQAENPFAQADSQTENQAPAASMGGGASLSGDQGESAESESAEGELPAGGADSAAADGLAEPESPETGSTATTDDPGDESTEGESDQ